jgi:hypothetical protein
MGLASGQAWVSLLCRIVWAALLGSDGLGIWTGVLGWATELGFCAGLASVLGWVSELGF